MRRTSWVVLCVLVGMSLGGHRAGAAIVLSGTLSPSDFTYSRIIDGDAVEDFLSATLTGPGGVLTPGDEIAVHLSMAPGFALVAAPGSSEVRVVVDFGHNDSGGFGDADFTGTVSLTGNGVPTSPQGLRYDYVYGDGEPTGSDIQFRNNASLTSDPQGEITGMDFSFIFPAAMQSDTPAPISLDTFGVYFEGSAFNQDNPESVVPLVTIQEVPEPGTVGFLVLAGVGLWGRSRRRAKV